jgi:hypothetical protein
MIAGTTASLHRSTTSTIHPKTPKAVIFVKIVDHCWWVCETRKPGSRVRPPYGFTRRVRSNVEAHEVLDFTVVTFFPKPPRLSRSLRFLLASCTAVSSNFPASVDFGGFARQFARNRLTLSARSSITATDNIPNIHQFW